MHMDSGKDRQTIETNPTTQPQPFRPGQKKTGFKGNKRSTRTRTTRGGIERRGTKALQLRCSFEPRLEEERRLTRSLHSQNVRSGMYFSSIICSLHSQNMRLDSIIFTKTAPPLSYRYIVNRLEVRVVVLHELHPLRHLLPELDVPVLAGGHEEVRAAGRHDRVAHHVAVHVAALVHRCRRQSFEIGLWFVCTYFYVSIENRQQSASRQCRDDTCSSSRGGAVPL